MGESAWSRSVRSWIRTNLNIERQLRCLPATSWTQVRYEDLCADPIGTMNRFFEFCGLDHINLPPDFHSVEHHIVGNRMRLSQVSHIRLDEKWRNTLSPSEQNCAWHLAGAMMERYGYSQVVATETEGETNG